MSNNSEAAMTHNAKLLIVFAILISVLVYGLFLPERACAHPHVFVENKLYVMFDENGLS